MNTFARLVLPFLTLSLAASAGPIPQGPRMTFIEDFETGTNTGNWSFFGNPANPIEVIEASGGHPGAFLHSTCEGLGCLDTFAPQFRTEVGVDSIFTGDYRAKGVTSLGLDTAIFGPEFVSTGDRPLTLVLVNDNGTADVFEDDVSVFLRTRRNIPAPNGHWRSYSYLVPSQSATLPRRWAVFQGTGDADADWNAVIENVTQVIFMYGDPELFYIFQQWEIGVDNLRIRLDQPPPIARR